MNEISSLNSIHSTLLNLINKYKKIILVGLSVSLILFLGYLIFSYVPLYSTSVDIFIRNLPSGNVIVDSDSSLIKSESGFSNPLFNFSELLKSEELATRVYSDLQEKYPKDVKKLKAKKNWTKTYNKLVKVKLIPSSDILTISMNWPNKKHAAGALDIVIKDFKAYNIEIRRSVESKQREYLDSQLIEASQNLDNLRKKITDYKIKNNVYDFQDEGSSLAIAKIDIVKQSELLKADLQSNEKKLATLASQLNVKNASEALRATGVGADPYLADLSTKLADAQQNYARISSQYTDKYPAVIEAKSVIAQIKRDIVKRQQETLGNYVIKRGIYDRPSQDVVRDMAVVESNVIAAKAQLSSLNKSVGTLNKDESDVESKKLKLMEMLKEEDALSLAYAKIKEKQLEAKIKENQVVDNISTLGSPDTPKFLLTNLLIKFVGFLLLGILGSLGLAWVLEEIEDNWKDPAEIEAVTGQKILGTIPWVNESYDFKNVIESPNSIFSIAYKNIANSLTLNSYKQNVQALSFVSTVNARGNSFITQNIFISLIKAGKSAILIDTDFTNPRKLIRDFNFDIEPKENDIVNAIDNINAKLRVSKNSVNAVYLEKLLQDVVIEIPVNNLVLPYLSSNNIVDEIYNYVSTPAFLVLINFLKSKYDFIILDTPTKPLIFPETSALVNIADAALIISGVESNRQELIRIINKLDNNNLKILGVIAREKNSELENYVTNHGK